MKSAENSAESALRLAPRFVDLRIRNRGNFRKKMRDSEANIFRFRCATLAKLSQHAPRALRYRVKSGNIGVISEFENRQSRQFCMKTKMNVEKARREAMHMN